MFFLQFFLSLDSYISFFRTFIISSICIQLFLFCVYLFFLSASLSPGKLDIPVLFFSLINLLQSFFRQFIYMQFISFTSSFLAYSELSLCLFFYFISLTDLWTSFFSHSFIFIQFPLFPLFFIFSVNIVRVYSFRFISLTDLFTSSFRNSLIFSQFSFVFFLFPRF